MAPSAHSPKVAGQATRHPALAMLRGALIAALVVGVNATAVSAVAAGLPGLWGALLGLLMVIVFSGAGLFALHLSRRTSPTMQLALAMMGWTAGEIWAWSRLRVPIYDLDEEVTA